MKRCTGKGVWNFHALLGHIVCLAIGSSLDPVLLDFPRDYIAKR